MLDDSPPTIAIKRSGPAGDGPIAGLDQQLVDVVFGILLTESLRGPSQRREQLSRSLPGIGRDGIPRTHQGPLRLLLGLGCSATGIHPARVGDGIRRPEILDVLQWPRLLHGIRDPLGGDGEAEGGEGDGCLRFIAAGSCLTANLASLDQELDLFVSARHRHGCRWRAVAPTA